MSIKEKELQTRVLKELECPVCLEMMVPPIKLCKNGHNLCCNCRVTLEYCPICRGPFVQVRNLSLESLLSEDLNPCKFSERGCIQLLKKSELKEHELKCQFGVYKCPFAVISKLECNWSGSLTQMRRHVEKHHDEKSVQHVSRKFKTVLYNVEKSQRFYQATVTLGQLFYIKWMLFKGAFHCAVFYIGPHERAADYKYRFAITTSDGETVSGCARTHSFMENVDSVYRGGKCISINHALLMRSYINGHLPIRMEISEAPKLDCDPEAIAHKRHSV